MLSTCRTAFNWAGRWRMLPPYARNPFGEFPIDKLKEPAEEATAGRVFTADQERAFFAAGGPWQRRVFGALAAYGLRVAEPTHLLVEDVDLTADAFTARSKPWLFWTVKTGRERQLPLTPETKPLFAEAIGTRKAGFVSVGAVFADGAKPLPSFATPAAFRSAAEVASRERCERFSAHAVGVWDDRPILYPLFSPVSPVELSDALLDQLGWAVPGGPRQTRAHLADLGGELTADARQRLAFVGHRTFDPEYREEKGGLGTYGLTGGGDGYLRLTHYPAARGPGGRGRRVTRVGHFSGRCHPGPGAGVFPHGVGSGRRPWPCPSGTTSPSPSGRT